MTDAEVGLLERHLRPSDHVWEWGSGSSTLWFAERVRLVTTVEHQMPFAVGVMAEAAKNVSVLYVPPTLEYVEGTEDDGSYDAFRAYVETYSGRGINVVLIDGRARVACARWIAECAQFGPSPELKVFVHDAHRAQYVGIWSEVEEKHVDEETGEETVTMSRPMWDVVDRVDSLVLLTARFER